MAEMVVEMAVALEGPVVPVEAKEATAGLEKVVMVEEETAEVGTQGELVKVVAAAEVVVWQAVVRVDLVRETKAVETRDTVAAVMARATAAD